MLDFPILMCDFRRIRDNEYEFPTDRVISSAVQHLIQQILTPNPSQRPTLHEIVDHAFFTQGPVPSYIPTSAHDGTPDFRHISKSVSDTNLKRLRKYALLDEEYPMAPMPSSTSGGVAASKSITTSIAQQEKEFQKAVQPGSPISALLSSARQPLLMGNPTGPSGAASSARENQLLRKLQAVKESPLGRRTVTRGLDGGLVEEEGGLRKRRMEEDEQEEEETRLRKKELEAQKARIVAQMAPVREDYEGEQPVQQPRKEKERERHVGATGRENVPPPTLASAPSVQRKDVARKEDRGRVAAGKEKENLPVTAGRCFSASISFFPPC